MAAVPTSLSFQVTRKTPELIPPAKPTPHEFKPLSDIDDQEPLRLQIPAILFYQKCPSMEREDPVKIIRDAIAKALEFYYPFAGRLRELDGGKLVVECTGEGVVFIEADADITLQQLGGAALYPPFPYLGKLLFDVPGTAGIVNCPLLLIQVTRLKCGGFVFAIRFNHTMSDATGFVQFMSAISELAQGTQAPSVPPVWQRHLLSARNPPRVTCTHQEYNVVPNATKGTLIPFHDMVERSFSFDATAISVLRDTLPPHIRRCSNFEIVTACVWRCLTIALYQNPNEEIRFICAVNCRKRFNPPLLEGYYGNAFVCPAAVTTVDILTKKPLQYAVELVAKAKYEATEEYVKSVADLMVVRGRPTFTVTGTYIVSSWMHIGFEEVDFGWGKALYGGPAKCGDVSIPCVTSFLTPFKNNRGENEIVLISLPSKSVDAFVEELGMMIGQKSSGACGKINEIK